MPSVASGADTILNLQGLGVPSWSARGLTETLTLIEAAAQITRSINGKVLNWSQPQFRKYRITLSCTDQRVLAFDGIWPGAEVIIDCVTELAYPVGGTPERTPVGGSERTEGSFVFYRPQIWCFFVGFNTNTPEYEATPGWEARFEEI
jgi:hypothetical protein